MTTYVLGQTNGYTRNPLLEPSSLIIQYIYENTSLLKCVETYNRLKAECCDVSQIELIRLTPMSGTYQILDLETYKAKITGMHYILKKGL